MTTTTEAPKTAQQGTISVHTENIFPIIKKFLYSDHEIFLRELVSNAVDATQKLRTLSSRGEAKGELGDLTIQVAVDKEAGTLTISDRGIGLTAEEVEKYINQIAFSGAEEFVEKYKKEGDGNQIIGHFGMGFYSAFMVADKVELVSRSFKEGAEAVKWTCEGSTSYSIETGDRESRGTDVILHVSEDSKEFLEEARIRGILNKYCKFLPVEIQFGEHEVTEGEGDDAKKITKPSIINTTSPAWMRSPNELKDEDYAALHSELYPMTEPPLFHIHLNVDHPFRLTGILYFPKLKENFDMQRNKVNLYCNQVFVTDDVSSVMPDFLTMLNGVIDSPDIPLNVSRSYLQSDANVKRISGHITKKVADKLDSMFKKDRADLEAKWNDVKLIIEYGMLTEEKFFDKAQNFALYPNTEGQYYTMEEHIEAVKAGQTDKNERTVILYASNPEEQHAYIAQAKERGYEVLLLDSPLVSHLISRLEAKNDKVSFARVDADTLDKLIQKDEVVPNKLSEEEVEALKPIFEKSVEEGKYIVSCEPMSENAEPVIVTRPEFMRRMREQQMTGGGPMMMGNMPEMLNLVVNTNHPLVSQILNTKTEKKKERLTKQVVDLALLGQGLLKGEELTKFIRRSVDLIK